jgi:hypothetical protein
MWDGGPFGPRHNLENGIMAKTIAAKSKATTSKAPQLTLVARAVQTFTGSALPLVRAEVERKASGTNLRGSLFSHVRTLRETLPDMAQYVEACVALFGNGDKSPKTRTTGSFVDALSKDEQAAARFLLSEIKAVAKWLENPAALIEAQKADATFQSALTTARKERKAASGTTSGADSKADDGKAPSEAVSLEQLIARDPAAVAEILAKVCETSAETRMSAKMLYALAGQLRASRVAIAR